MNRFLTLLLVAFSVSLSLAACSRSEPAEEAPVFLDPAPYCSLPDELGSITPKLEGEGFALSHERVVDEAGKKASFIVTATRTVRGIDGQKVGEEGQTIRIADKDGQCEQTVLSVRRQVGAEERISDLVTGISSYKLNGRLIYQEQALRSPTWHKVYASPNLIPEKVPNPLTQAGEDLYMTWVSRGQGVASRMPVWVQDGVWTKDGDQFTLVAGLVAFRNPRDGDLKSDELVYVMRFDQSSVVNFRGILFPVSRMTYESFLDYQKSHAEEWSRDRTGDSAAASLLYEGPMTRSRLRKIPLEKVWAFREVQPAPLPQVPHGFVPDFAELKPLF